MQFQSTMEMGNSQPSEVLDQMLKLHGTKEPNFLVRFAFRKMLPPPTRPALTALPVWLAFSTITSSIAAAGKNKGAAVFSQSDQRIRTAAIDNKHACNKPMELWIYSYFLALAHAAWLFHLYFIAFGCVVSQHCFHLSHSLPASVSSSSCAFIRDDS